MREAAGRAGRVSFASAALGGGLGLQLSLLRGFELTSDCEFVPMATSSQRLLAFLALQERALPRAYVAGVLWADTSEARAFGNLRSALWRLRLAGPGAVNVFGDHLRLAPEVMVDIRQARELSRRLLNGSCPGKQELVDQQSFEGELLPGWYEDWVLVERERHRQLSLQALETLCERLTSLGRIREAVQAGIAAVSSEPLRESAQRALIAAHLADGNAVEAIRQYREYSRTLARELGLVPSNAIQKLVDGVCRDGHPKVGLR